MRLGYGVGIVAVFLATSLAQAALVQQGALINIEASQPSGRNIYAGGGIAFIPGGTDSIAQDTLVINWLCTDTVDTSKANQVFQRITIPAGAGTPTVLATATIRWNMTYSGTSQYGTTSGNDLAFDAVNKKLVTTGIGTSGNSRFVSFDLFSSDTTIGSVGYSGAVGDNGSQLGRAVTMTPTGEYLSFYSYGTNVRKATVSPTGMSGGALTKTDVAKPAAPSWYPNADGYPATTNGNGCEGVVLYGDSYLMLRSFKSSATKQEDHIYQIDSDFDAAAINGYTDLGDVHQFTGITADRAAWGLTADPTTGTAFIRYGYSNQAGQYNRIQVVSGLPIVPEPATLALVVLGGVGLLLRRRHA